MNGKDGNNKEKQTTDNPNNDITDPTPISHEEQQIKPNYGENDGHNKKENGWPHRVQAIFTGLIFFVTAAYAVVAWFQWRTMSGQLDEMIKTVKITEDSNKANKKSIELAERSIKATQEQFRLDQRAWLNMREPKFTEPLNSQKSLRISFTIKNVGKTPAQRVHYRYKVSIQTPGKPILWIPFIPIVFENSDICYAPGDENTTQIMSKSVLTQEMIDFIESGGIIFSINIEVTYFDIYNVNNIRHSRACFLYSAPNKRFVFCKTGSFMD